MPDASYTLTFKLYDMPTGGSPIWTETQNVQVTNGLFNVILGSSNHLDIPFEKPYWLGLTVGGDLELTPRIQLTSSPYSLSALSVAGISNIFPADGPVGIGTVTPGQKLEVAGMIKANGFEGNLVITSMKAPSSFRITLEPVDNPGILSYLEVYKTGDPIFWLEETGDLTATGEVQAMGGFRFPDGTVQSTAVTAGGDGGGWTRDAVNNEVGLARPHRVFTEWTPERHNL